MTEFFLFVAAISAPFLVGGFISHYFRYRAEVAKRTAAQADERVEAGIAELTQELDALRRRVEVLETIVTDEKYDLRLKIANL